MEAKDFWKELKSLVNKDSWNHERIIILLHILWDIDRSKNEDLYKGCNTMNEAIKAYKEAISLADMVRSSCGL